MKAIITGTRGFIGGHALPYLADRGVHPTVGDDAEVIFSIASGSEVSNSLEQPRRFIRNNVDLILDLLELARTMPNLRHFIHLSTSEVYGPCETSDDHAEWSPIVTHSPYSASKAAQEAILMGYWKSFGVPVTIVNTMNVFGEQQQPHKFIPMAVRKILAGEELVLHGSPEYETRRRYIHADCVADAMLFIAERPYRPEENRPQRFNVVGEQELSLSELASKISLILGVNDSRFRYRFQPATRPGHVGRYALDGKNLWRRGWCSPGALQDTLTRTVAHLASSGKLSAGASIDRGATPVELASGETATPSPPSIIPG